MENKKLKDLFFKTLLVLIPAFVFLVFYGSAMEKEHSPLSFRFWFLFSFLTILTIIIIFAVYQKITTNFLRKIFIIFVLGFLFWFIGTQIYGSVICKKANGRFLERPFEGIYDVQGDYHSGGTRTFSKPRICHITLEQSKAINLEVRPYNYIDFVIKN